MKPDSNGQLHRTADVYRNIMLYWDNADPFPQGIIEIAEEWRRVCSEWNIMLFGKESAQHFLRDNFGKDISRLFLSCALPTMRSDFFRVFWAFSEGGIYSDMRFIPLCEPLFFEPRKNLTLPIHSIGRISNGIFYSKKESIELKSIQYEIIKSLREQKHQSVFGATGPGAWMRALVPGPDRKLQLQRIMSQGQMGEIEIVTWETLRKKFLLLSKYPGPERFTHMHWTLQQRRMSIYHHRSSFGSRIFSKLRR